jgi:hypothetical protein
MEVSPGETPPASTAVELAENSRGKPVRTVVAAGAVFACSAAHHWN